MIKNIITYTIYIVLILLIVVWGYQGRAEATVPNNSPDYCWEIQKSCDEVIMEADKTILLQLRAYSELSRTNKDLEKDLKLLRAQNFSLKNPPWYKDPMWTGLAGVLGGVIIILGYRK